MDNLKLLIELQKNYNVMNEASKTLNNYSSYLDYLKKMKKEFNELKEEFSSKAYEINNIRKQYKIASGKIKAIKKDMEECNYRLYNFSGSNIKLINGLQNEIDSYKNSVDHLEDECYKLLESEDTLKAEMNTIKDNLINKKNDFYDYKNKKNDEVKKAKENMVISKELIEKNEKNLPESILKDFKRLISKNGMAVVKCENGICLGCRVKVSFMTLDRIKKNNQIIHCDNCGRILFSEDK